jgi:hypothetical protein
MATLLMSDADEKYHVMGANRAPTKAFFSSGGQFLLAFAIPHFFYHLTTAYGILRNRGVQLTMGDFLGNWGTS